MKRNSFTHHTNCYKTENCQLVRGFTLTELLMVVVVIAILAAIMYPRFQTFRTRARLKEVPNTIQLILAGEKYYYGKVGGYFPWTWAQADNFNYTVTVANPSPPPETLDFSIEDDILNIALPTDICEYWVDDTTTPGTWAIHFRKADDDTKVGECVIQTGNYTIESPYEKYLGYLE